jgi:outer membrane protein OmpA-like peptidoglycan-associated protein
MGEAFTAVADDANTVLYNPAGFAEIHSWEAAGMYASLYNGLNPGLYNGGTDQLGYNFVSLAVPLSMEAGSLGASWVQLNSQVYQENTLSLGYGRRILQSLPLDLGLNVRMLQWQVAANDYTTDPSLFPSTGRQKTGFTGDLGLLAEVAAGLRVGVAGENLIPVSMGINNETMVPMVLRAGLAYTYAFSQRESLLVTAEYSQRQSEMNVNAGAEAWLFNGVLALRAGANLDQLTAGLGFRFGWNDQPLGLELDYAFAYPLQVVNTSSHRLGLLIRWEPQPAPEKTAAKKSSVEKSTVEKTRKTGAEVSDMDRMTMESDQRLREKIEELERQKKALQQELDRFNHKIQVGGLNPILFKTGKAELLDNAIPTVKYLGGILARYPELIVRIEGHTDAQGNDRYNLLLSQSRVESVQKYITRHYKVYSSHLIAIGYGKLRPIASNKTETSRKKNRRVEFKVIHPYEKFAD